MSEATEQVLSIPQWTLADRLRKSLDHAGIAPSEMAQYLEVHRNTVSNWVYGHARPPASAVKLWAMRCGVPYEWLQHGDELPRVDSNHQPTGWWTEPGPPSTAEIASTAKPIDGLRQRIRRGPEVAVR